MREITMDTAAGAVRRHGSDWYERLARLGFAAKGVVYVLVGAIAASAAFGDGTAQGSTGALRTLLDESLGQVLLGVVAVGLLGYVLWRFVSAFANPDGDGTGRRIYNFGTGVAHLALAIEAARLALAARGGGGGEDAPHWTAAVMAQPFGVIAVGIAGGAFILYGLYQAYRGITADIDRRLDLHRMSPGAVVWVIRLGRAGLVARGIVFGLIGVFLIVAALQSDPSEARGLGGALRTLQGETYGPWLLGAVAVGLIAYGLFQFVRARYRRIHRTAMS